MSTNNHSGFLERLLTEAILPAVGFDALASNPDYVDPGQTNSGLDLDEGSIFERVGQRSAQQYRREENFWPGGSESGEVDWDDPDTASIMLGL